MTFVHTPKIPLDIELGVTLIEQGNTSHQNYAMKLQARLKWTYQNAQENSQKKSARHKNIMTRE